MPCSKGTLLVQEVERGTSISPVHTHSLVPKPALWAELLLPQGVNLLICVLVRKRISNSKNVKLLF